MKTKYQFLITSILIICFSAICSAQQGVVTVDQDEEITKLLDYKKDIETLKVYKIQVFQNVDPDKAQKEKLKFLNAYSDWPVEIIWNTPNYKVWVGNFTSRLEADRALVKIKKKYMNAIIFQPKPKSKDNKK